MNPIITIITINYNDKIGLEKTIQSVTSQTWKDFEYIVMDGNSSDGSKEVIEKYKNQISYWKSEPDSGVFNAMNKAIRASTGTFLLFMNGGDVFCNTTVLEEINTQLKPEFDIYYGNQINKKPSSERLKTYSEKLTFSFFYSSSLNHQSTFIRKSLFDEHFYYSENYKIASDWEFFIYTICHKNVPYKYLNKTIAIYDITGISSNPANKALFYGEKKEILEKYFPAFVSDYVQVSELNSKRFKQIFYIRNRKNSWRFLKWFMSLLLLFLPKMPKND
jgi:glycosyltransferase involved in cell wall biosynthesis